jgi:multiple sugar transport system substrate-binding protein
MKKRGLCIVIGLVLAVCIAGMAYAADSFSWTKYQGKTVKLLLNKHPYTDSMLPELDKFQKMTGIKVTYDIFPEEQYFDKLTVVLSSGSSDYDVFMTGAYQIWQYAPPGWVEPLEKYISDTGVTSPDYNASDILPNLMASLRWDLTDGHKTGTGHQWALPWGFEMNSMTYNKRIFDSLGLKPPKTFAEVIKDGKLIEQKYPGVVGIVVRGTRNWGTIHPGFMTGYVSAGGEDFDTNLNPVMNSAIGVRYAKAWVDMVKQVGPSQWATFTWNECHDAMGSGKAAMFFDADIGGYFINLETSEKGNFAFAPGPGLDGPATKSNVWIWSLGMNAASKSKVPAWYWMQWATGKDFTLTAALNGSLVNPSRQSVWDNADFQKHIAGMTDYLATFKALSKDAKVYFTPQSRFMEVTTEWASSLQDIYAGADAKATLDKLATSLKK